MSNAAEPATAEGTPTAERRRAPLTQPDFSSYQRANAYPGPSFFFVGHSYDVEISDADNARLSHRIDAIRSLFREQVQWVPVQSALNNQQFKSVLTRFEFDLLHRLPETALIGPAIDEKGNEIAHSFTIWREERRKPRTGESLPG
jgi:hypothetical protein